MVRNYGDCQLVRRGYKAYKHHAVYQQKLLLEGQFSPMLVRGLQKLHSLTAVTLESGWPSLYEYKERRTGSTLARVWSPLYCPPSSWIWEPAFYTWGDEFPAKKGPDGAEHCRTLTSALVQAQRPIRQFKIPIDFSSGLPSHTFDGAASSKIYSQGLGLRSGRVY